MQLNQIIFPAPKSTYTQVSISLLPNSELLYIPSGTMSPCLTCSPPQTRVVPVLLVKANSLSNKYVLFFHSNSEDIYHCYDYLKPVIETLNLNFILVEFPGYGIYSNQSPSADLINEDARAVYEYFIIKRRIPQTDIVVMGRSIGCGPACMISSKYSPAGLITISAYTSIQNVVENIVGTMLSRLIKERFQNLELIQEAKCPILVIHGLRDQFISYEHSKLLISNSKGRIKQYHFSENMTHNQFDIDLDIIAPLKHFLDRIEFQTQTVSQFDHKIIIRKQNSKHRSFNEQQAV